eukprot:SM006946S21014  [mRNA]  locus=s6946:305:771:- [translate_table: standard]
MAHVRRLAGVGPHPVGSAALDDALDYVRAEVRRTAESAASALAVEVEEQRSGPGAMQLSRGLFVGKTLVYAGLTNIAVRLASVEATHDAPALLLSTHVDTVSTA